MPAVRRAVIVSEKLPVPRWAECRPTAPTPEIYLLATRWRRTWQVSGAVTEAGALSHTLVALSRCPGALNSASNLRSSCEFCTERNIRFWREADIGMQLS